MKYNKLKSSDQGMISHTFNQEYKNQRQNQIAEQVAIGSTVILILVTKRS